MILQDCDILDLFNGPYSVRQSGNIGREILDADGTIVCWTCDEVLAVVLVELLNRIAGAK